MSWKQLVEGSGRRRREERKRKRRWQTRKEEEKRKKRQQRKKKRLLWVFLLLCLQINPVSIVDVIKLQKLHAIILGLKPPKKQSSIPAWVERKRRRRRRSSKRGLESRNLWVHFSSRPLSFKSLSAPSPRSYVRTHWFSWGLANKVP